jgi:hypothetical protein
VTKLAAHSVPKFNHFLVSTILLALLFSLVAYVVAPDARQSSIRTQLAAQQSGQVFRLVSEDGASYFEQWVEGHRFLGQAFTNEQDESLVSLFKLLNASYYEITDHFKTSTLNSTVLTEASVAYSEAAERIYFWEVVRFSEASKRYQWFLGLSAFATLAMVVGFFWLFVVRKFSLFCAQMAERDQLFLEQREQSAVLKTFLYNAFKGFDEEFLKLKRTLQLSSTERDNPVLKMHRSTKIALAYASELANPVDRDAIPFSVEGFMQDVMHFLRTETGLSPSVLAFEMHPPKASVSAFPDLLGPIVSQLCISLLELGPVSGIQIGAQVSNVDDDRVKLEFSLRPVTRTDLDDEVLLALIDKQKVGRDFGPTLINGLTNLMGGKCWVEQQSGIPCLAFSVLCEAYADEVSADDNSELIGKRVFIYDANIERLRMMVRQLSSYGVQATPFNGLASIVESPKSISKFDAGILVIRNDMSVIESAFTAMRSTYAPNDLSLLGVYADADGRKEGFQWDALLSGDPSEAELVAALRFCLSSATHEAQHGHTADGEAILPTQQAARQRENR